MREKEDESFKNTPKSKSDSDIDYNSDENDEDDGQKFLKYLKNGKYKDKHFKKSSKNNDGIEFTPFDLREENEEGHFDENLFYIPNKEPIDPWYESVKDEIKKKELLKQKRKKNDKDEEDDEEEEEEDDDDDYSKYGDEDLYYKEEKITKEEENKINSEIKSNRIKLINILQGPDETVKDAIKRLKNINPNRKGDKKNQKRKLIKNNKKEDIKIEEDKKEDNKNKDLFNDLLSLVSKLTELSFFDVYSDSIRNIAKDYGYKSVMIWKYKIIENQGEKNEKETVYGDYDSLTIHDWDKLKYFENKNEGENKTEFQFMFMDPMNKNNPNAGKWITKDNKFFKIFFNNQ